MQVHVGGIAIAAGTMVRDALAVLLGRDASTLIVVDAERKPLGAVSRDAIFRSGVPYSAA